MWAVQYTYDDQAERRDQVRPAHREYLTALVDTGEMLAFGRFEDHLAPGALLLVKAPTREAVNALVSRDPFVTEGLVPEYTIRHWVGTWGAIDGRPQN